MKKADTRFVGLCCVCAGAAGIVFLARRAPCVDADGTGEVGFFFFFFSLFERARCSWVPWHTGQMLADAGGEPADAEGSCGSLALV